MQKLDFNSGIDGIVGADPSAPSAGASDLKGRVVRGGVVVMAGQAAKLLLRMGSLVLLARLLDPKDFGLVGMATAITGVFAVVKDAGLSTVTVQRADINNDQTSTLFWINMAFGVVLAVLLLALAPGLARFYREPRLFWVTIVLASGFVFNAAAVQHSALLQRQMRFTILAVTEVLSLLIGNVVGVVLALAGYTYWALVGMTVVQTAVTAVCVWMATGWIPGLPRRNVGARSMLRFGGTVSLNTIVVYAAYNCEKVLLGRFWGAEALGLYGRAYQLVSLPTDLLNSSAGSVAFPALSRLHGQPERFRVYFLKGYSLVLALTLPLTFGCALFAQEIIQILLGPKWQEAGTIFRLLAPTILVFALINPLAWLMLSLGMVGRSLKTALVLSPIVIIAYVIGLPYGPIGVAFAYSAAMTLWFVPHTLWCIHGTMISGRDLLNAAGKTLVAAVAGAIVGFGVQALCRDLPSPLLRLLLAGSALVASYVWMLLYGMGQKAFYADLLKRLTNREVIVGSEA